jgi:hypothetical protein
MRFSNVRNRRVAAVVIPLTAVGMLLLPLSISSFAQGGTAKPPAGAIAPFITPTLPDPSALGALAAQIHGFDDTGFIQGATVDTTNANCPNTPADQPSRFGGTVTLNHGVIVVPCNMVIQAPANTFTWADFVNTGPDLTLGKGYPSFEMHAIGNIVGDRRIAGLLYTSQLSLNGSTGVITGIDYATGNLLVDTGDAANPAIVQINDPKGRFGRAQSPDPRFSVDDANPTIHSGTGYPMCVPRTDPATADDALCPQANRPKPSATGQCRNFSVSGIAPPVSGELAPAPAGAAYCSEFVMPSVADPSRTATDPDPRQQAPFEVGDSITFSGTLFPATATKPAYTSAHTIEANIGIFTMPGTQPSYLAIGDFGVGTADPSLIAINGVAVETQNRLFLESETTDVKTPVDIYMMDVDPLTGAVRNRWATPFAMTGEQNGPLQADGLTPIGGGITTQQTGPQPQRARLRASKAPFGLLSQPTRTVRVAVRSLCTPQAPVNDAAGNPVLTSLDACLNKNDSTNQVANGLEAGQYFAPTFEYIFPENVKPGDLLAPYDFWHLPFIVKGEGSTTASAIGPSVGPLEPTPWGGPPATVPGAPTIGSSVGGNASATVGWAPPTSNGGAPITGFIVTALDAANNAVGTVTVAGNVTSATVTGLANGTAVSLQVQATNQLGIGPASGLSNAVTPAATAPTAPGIGTATAADASAVLTWTPPASDGGSSITGYEVVVTASGAVVKTVTGIPAADIGTLLTGLTNGTAYTFQVRAVNLLGLGALSAPSNTVTPIPAPVPVPAPVPGPVPAPVPAPVAAPLPAPILVPVPIAPAATAPGVPAIGVATAGTASALVRFARPANGGSVITGFLVRVVNATTLAQVGALRPATAAATSLTVGALANGTAVRFQVQARNAIGTGAFSALSGAVVPAKAPGAPRILTASSGFVGGPINAVARWAPPAANGGPAINGYVVVALRISATGAVLSQRSSAVQAASVRALRMTLPAGNYRFVVRARNRIGLGASSARSNLVRAR